MLSLLLGLSTTGSAVGPADQLVLQSDRVRATGSKVSVGGSITSPLIAVTTLFPSKELYPGVQLIGPGEGWDLGAYARVSATIRNAGGQPLSIACRVDSPALYHDGTRHSLNASAIIPPGKSRTLVLPIERLQYRAKPEALLGMWGLPEEAFGDSRGRVDAWKIVRILFYTPDAQHAHNFEITDLHAEGAYQPVAEAPATQPFFPMIDRFGQFMHRDWPGKTRDEAQLKQAIVEESADLAAHPGPQDWDEFGGWTKGPTHQATGFFRTEKIDEKWWLITPGGRLFWAHSINAVGEHDYTPIEDRETWFADAIWQQPAFEPFRRQAPGKVVRGSYKDRQPRTFSFHQANLLRKYGDDWQARYAGLAHQRLRSWGFNAIGTWTSPDIWRDAKPRTPYFILLDTGRSRTIDGSTGFWRKFPDPFDSNFAQDVGKKLSELADRGVTTDPWCIGFYVDNENTWKHDTYLAEASLESPADQPAKVALIEQLRQKYKGIESLNTAWGTQHESWDALLAHRGMPPKSDAATADMRIFYAAAADAYFAKCRAVIKGLAPHHLYLGCRFPYQVNHLVTEAAKRSCDVMSVNWYQYDVTGFEVPGGLDLPLIIGEFHFGALDRGLFHPGLKRTENQSARAAAYQRFVRSALEHPNVVGTTWFKYSDEPCTGRWLDTENYQIGFLDVCDTPYPETVDASRQVGQSLYDLRSADQSGSRKP